MLAVRQGSERSGPHSSQVKVKAQRDLGGHSPHSPEAVAGFQLPKRQLGISIV